MATYYVRTDGNNGNNGSTGSPWATIQHGLNTMAAGDTLLVGNGTWNVGSLAASGSAGAYKTVRSENYRQALIRTSVGNGNCFGGSGHSYLKIQNFDISSSDAHGIECERFIDD